MKSGFNRRQLLSAMGAASVLPLVPQASAIAFATTECVSNRKAVVTLYLQGGIHGLSLLVPRGVQPYFDRHPTLGIANSLTLDSIHGINPVMPNLHALYQQGKVALMNGAGYPGHSQSHDIAHSVIARGMRGTTEFTGWIGRYARQYCSSDNFFSMVSLGGSSPIEFSAPQISPVSITDLDNYGLYYRQLNTTAEDLRFLRQTTAQLHTSAVPANNEIALLDGAWGAVEESFDLLEAISQEGGGSVQYPTTTVASAFRQAARLLRTNLVTVKHLYLSMGGFDTHSFQGNSLNTLLAQLDGAIGAFYQDLAEAGRAQDVVLSIRSEFGRTFENGSQGTDHGQGSLEVLIGDNVQGGVHSPAYTEADFTGAFLPVKFDFREVLEQVLAHHLDVDPGPVLPEAFSRIGLQLFQ